MNVAVAWIDEHEAKLFLFSEHQMARRRLNGADESRFDEISEEMKGFKKILVLGPDEPRNRFCAWLKKTHPDQAQRIIASELLLDPTDAQIADRLRHYFKKPLTSA